MKSVDYDGLAVALLEHAIGEQTNAAVARLIGIRSHRVSEWRKQKTAIRASTWLLLLHKQGHRLQDIVAAVIAPAALAKKSAGMTGIGIQKNLVAPLLTHLRGDRTLKEVQGYLGLPSFTSYNHWETGKRDTPLAMMLRAIDVLGSRLQVFCEAVGFRKRLADFGAVGSKPEFSQQFFALPWTPTVFLAIQTEQYEKQRRHRTEKLARQLQLEEHQIEEALRVLSDLELVRFDGRLYRHRKGQFYAPPNLSRETIDRLHSYWFSRSPNLCAQPGLHKIEEHALSRESIEKIIGWVTELREKIRQEVKQSSPETVVHIHWQIAEMLPI